MSETPASTAHPSPVAPADAAGGGAGRASLILAIVLVAFGVVVQIVAQLAPQIAYDFQLAASGLAAIFAVTTIVSGAVAIVVIILGAIGIQPRQPRGRLAAAAGLAIGASHLLAAVVALVAPLVLYAVL